MTHPHIHRFNVTILCILVGIGFIVAPPFTQKSLANFHDLSLTDQIGWWVMEDGPDSEWPTEELPFSVKEVTDEAIMERDYEQPDSEWPSEELPLAIKGMTAEDIAQLDYEQPDNEWTSDE